MIRPWLVAVADPGHMELLYDLFNGCLQRQAAAEWALVIADHPVVTLTVATFLEA